MKTEKVLFILTDVKHGRESCMFYIMLGASKLTSTLGWKCESCFARQSKLCPSPVKASFALRLSKQALTLQS